MPKSESSIGKRLSLMIVGGGGIIALAMCVLFTIYQIYVQLGQFSDELHAHAKVAGVSCSYALSFNEPKDAEETLKALGQIPALDGIDVYDESGNLFARLVIPGRHVPKEAVLPSDGNRLTWTQLSVTEPIDFRGNHLGTIVAHANLRLFYGMVYQNMRFAVVLLLCIAASILLLAKRIRKEISEPLSNLANTARNIAESKDFSLRTQIDSSDEIGELAHAFDTMLAEINTYSSALKKSERNLRLTLDSIEDAVLTVDTVGAVTSMNPVAERLTGWTLAEAEGVSIDQVFKLIDTLERNPVDCPVLRMCASDQPHSPPAEALLVSKSGREYRVAKSVAPIRTSTGDVLGVILVFRDTTEEFMLEQQLHHSQRMDAIGKLAGGIAHDFNNMIGGITGAAELLELSIPKGDRNREFIGLIQGCCDQAADLTRKLLSFARKHPPASTVIDVHDVITETAGIIKHLIDRKIEFSTSLTSESSRIVGDPMQLQSAFLNMAINASHAMSNGGKLTISTRLVELDETTCTSSSFDVSSGQFINVEIRDTGSGIPPENLDKVFDPFFTTKEKGKGTGLGLASVYGTVKQHRGMVSVYSEVGKGTLFQLLLPITEEDASVGMESTVACCGNGRILLVDDELAMRVTGQAILESLGYTVELAKDGKDALQTFSDASESFDLVILDMIMPKMGGRECFSELRKIQPNCKIIVASGFSKENDVAQMLEEGLKGFIQKPFQRVVLSKMVFDILT